jgi:hypothetical protein
MKINELFDLKSAYDTKKVNRGKHSWVSELPDGSELEIRIWRDDRFNPLQVYYTQFGRTRAMGEPKIGKTYSISDMDELNFDITGEGDAVKILVTVLKRIGQWIKNNQPKYFYFTANEPSRAKLYQSMVNRLASQYGYHQVDQKSAPTELQLLWSADFVKWNGTPFLLARN